MTVHHTLFTTAMVALLLGASACSGGMSVDVEPPQCDGDAEREAINCPDDVDPAGQATR